MTSATSSEERKSILGEEEDLVAPFERQKPPASRANVAVGVFREQRIWMVGEVDVGDKQVHQGRLRLWGTYGRWRRIETIINCMPDTTLSCSEFVPSQTSIFVP